MIILSLYSLTRDLKKKIVGAKNESSKSETIASQILHPLVKKSANCKTFPEKVPLCIPSFFPAGNELVCPLCLRSQKVCI